MQTIPTFTLRPDGGRDGGPSLKNEDGRDYTSDNLCTLPAFVEIPAAGRLWAVEVYVPVASIIREVHSYGKQKADSETCAACEDFMENGARFYADDEIPARERRGI